MKNHRPILGIAVAGMLWVSPSLADDVHLVNGKVYEGVIAEEVAAGVRIQLPFGRLTIPHAQVARIERAASPLAELLRRQTALEADPRATGGDWLELARWARRSGLDHGARSAALRAAELDPALGGLEGLLRPAGYAFDEEQYRWVPLGELMSRRGYVLDEGRWIPLEVHRELERAEQERRRLRAETALLEAQRRHLEAQWRREEEGPRHAPDPGYEPAAFGYGMPWGWPGSVVVVVQPARHRAPGHRPGKPPQVVPGPAAPPAHGYGALVDRAPGSLIPVGRGMPPVMRGGS
jgi:hypothetical protein